MFYLKHIYQYRYYANFFQCRFLTHVSIWRFCEKKIEIHLAWKSMNEHNFLADISFTTTNKFHKNLETVTIYGQNTSLFYFFKIFITYIPTHIGMLVLHITTPQNIFQLKMANAMESSYIQMVQKSFVFIAFHDKSFISPITLEWHFLKKQEQKNVLKVLQEIYIALLVSSTTDNGHHKTICQNILVQL